MKATRSPNSDPTAAPRGLRPPSFRTAVHRQLEDPSDPKRPPSFETGYRETLLDSPGYVVEASDRTYVTTPEGSIRLATIPHRVANAAVQERPRKRHKKAQDRQQAKARERIEAEIQKRDRRRRERTLRHGLDDALYRAEKSRKHAERLLEQVRNGKVIQPPRFGKRQALSEAERKLLAERDAVELRPERPR